VYIGPEGVPALTEAVTAAGGTPAALEDADAVVWLNWEPSSMPELPEHLRLPPGIAA